MIRVDQAGSSAAPGSGTARARSILDVVSRMSGISRAALVTSLPGTSSARSVDLGQLGERRQIALPQPGEEGNLAQDFDG